MVGGWVGVASGDVMYVKGEGGGEWTTTTTSTTPNTSATTTATTSPTSTSNEGVVPLQCAHCDDITID